MAQGSSIIMAGPQAYKFITLSLFDLSLFICKVNKQCFPTIPSAPSDRSLEHNVAKLVKEPHSMGGPGAPGKSLRSAGAGAQTPTAQAGAVYRTIYSQSPDWK